MLLIKKRAFRKGFCTRNVLVPYLDAVQYRSVEGRKLVVSLILLLEISFSGHMIPEAFLKISFLSLVANVQLYASNGQDWVRILEMWSPESDGEHFYSKSRVVTFFFFVPFPMFIFLPTEFQISLMILMSINFCKASS